MIAAKIAGLRFGKLRAIASTDERTRSGKILWDCICDCGKRLRIPAAALNSGNTKSCGCTHGGANETHGHTKGGVFSSEYRSWAGMKSRCTTPTNKKFTSYGGRGIKVCSRWLNSFETFLEDMGRKPTPKHSIDRYPDNDGNYEPGNCRWATNKEQSNNRRIRRPSALELADVEKVLEVSKTGTPLREIAIMFGVSKSTVYFIVTGRSVYARRLRGATIAKETKASFR